MRQCVPMASTRATLTFLGAAGTVTGSKYLLTLGDRRVLVDCGMFQGEKAWREKNWDEFPVPPASITDVILTHAHMDHSGMIPALVKQGFAGAIWMTDGTRRLVEVVLRDSAHLQESEAEDANEGGYSKHAPALPLYTTEDVERSLPLMRVVPFGKPIDLGGGLTALYVRAGHILGSASVLLRAGDGEVLFSGDLGRHDHPILRSRDTPPGSPYVVIESTYGDREHPEPTDLPHEAMADAIRRTLKRGGSVLIPAFAIDRTELVLKTLWEMRRDGRIPQCPIWVNSPMALSALDAYRALPEEIRPDVHMDEFANLPDLHEARSTEESKKLTDPEAKNAPGIIISSSGMATGGRVVHHLAAMLPDKRNTVVLTGYQAVGTRGRQLLQGDKQLKMFGRYVPALAEVVQDSEFSVHGDASDLIDWLRDLSPKPQTVFVTHGEEGSAAALAGRITRELGLLTVVPKYREVVSLQPTAGGYEVLAPGEDAVAPSGDGAASVGIGGGPAPEPPSGGGAASGWQRGDGTRAGVGVPATRKPSGWVNVAAPGVPHGAHAAPAVAHATAPAASELPSGKQRYRCLTGPDDASFCEKVSAALAEGYVLQGGPAVTFDGKRVIVAQAVVWPGRVE